METDRELLELAAKAAGLGVKWEQAHGCFWIEMGQGLPINHWNPLADDGDAFRLMVMLGINIERAIDADVYAGPPHTAKWLEQLGDHTDPFAMVRRAIVCAAAEIQRAKLPTPKEPA